MRQTVKWCAFCMRATIQTLHFSAAVVGREDHIPDTAICGQCNNQSRLDPDFQSLRSRVSLQRREIRSKRSET